MNIEVFLQIFLWFKFCTSVQICIYLPTFVLIYTLCNRCCPTERYIRTVRIPGDLWCMFTFAFLSPSRPRTTETFSKTPKMPHISETFQLNQKMLKNLLTNFLGSFQIRKDPMSDIGTLKLAWYL